MEDERCDWCGERQDDEHPEAGDGWAEFANKGEFECICRKPFLDFDSSEHTKECLDNYTEHKVGHYICAPEGWELA